MFKSELWHLGHSCCNYTLKGMCVHLQLPLTCHRAVSKWAVTDLISQAQSGGGFPDCPKSSPVAVPVCAQREAEPGKGFEPA